MFDSHTLTPEIKTYLADEATFLGETMNAGYHTVIEVGCGYGRYLNWALRRGYSYVGVDIVGWMVEMGQMRVASARKKYPGANCDILLQSAETLDKTLRDRLTQRNKQRALVFFPFNCLGNVAKFDAVVDSLKECQLDVLISTFKTDGASTKIRKEYYGKCGYEQLNSRIMKQGLLIVSEEGFHAMAYHHEFLTNALQKRGFELLRQEQSSNVGNILYLSYGKRGETPDSAPLNKNIERLQDGIEVSVCAIENDPLRNSSSENVDGDSDGADGGLLSFRESVMNCRPLSAERFQCRGTTKFNPGTTLRLVLPVMPQSQSELDESVWYADLVAEVESCESLGDSSYNLIVRLSKPEPALLDQLL